MSQGLREARRRAQTHQSHAVNRYLGAHGLGTLGENAGAAVAQMAYLVVDHDHFRSLLMACEPPMRREMYGAMTPHLRFPAKPLEDYIIEGKRIAEQEQLPVATEGGGMRAFNVPEIVSPELAEAQAAANLALAKGALEMVCRKCTRVERFPAPDRATGIKAARDAGWTYDEVKGDGREICPACP